MGTAFEVDETIKNNLSSNLSLMDYPNPSELYNLSSDLILKEQEQHESSVRSYPRRLPIAIKQAYGALVEDMKGQFT